MSFTLIKTIDLNHFVVKVYQFSNDNNTIYVEESYLNDVTNTVINSESVREVFESYASLFGVAKTEIYDLSNSLILASEIGFE
jgi:hypothetical protein